MTDGTLVLILQINSSERGLKELNRHSQLIWPKEIHKLKQFYLLINVLHPAALYFSLGIPWQTKQTSNITFQISLYISAGYNLNICCRSFSLEDSRLIYFFQSLYFTANNGLQIYFLENRIKYTKRNKVKCNRWFQLVWHLKLQQISIHFLWTYLMVRCLKSLKESFFRLSSRSINLWSILCQF